MSDSVDYVVCRRTFPDRRPVVGVITRDDLIDLQGAGEDIQEIAKFEADGNDQMPWLNLSNVAMCAQVTDEASATTARNPHNYQDLENSEYKYYVVIDRVFTGDHQFSHATTIWAKCNWFSGLVSFPLEGMDFEDSDDGNGHWVRYVEFKNPDWSSTIPSPSNNEGQNLFAPCNYERDGFLWPDSSDYGKDIDR